MQRERDGSQMEKGTEMQSATKFRRPRRGGRVVVDLLHVAGKGSNPSLEGENGNEYKEGRKRPKTR